MIKVKVNNEYKDIVKIFCGGTLQKEITKVWSREAQDYVYESSVEYTGTLPVTITANGDVLIDYRIYGADGGVGVATENLLSTSWTIGFLLGTDGKLVPNTNYQVTDFIDITTETHVFSVTILSSGNTVIRIWEYEADDTPKQALYSLSSPPGKQSFTFTSSTGRICISTAKNTIEQMLVKGSTAPTSYIPYGYKLPMVTRFENLFDGTLNLGYYINKDFGMSSTTFVKYRSMQVYLPAGTYSLMFGKTIYMVRELIDGGYSEDSFNTQIYTFQCNTDGYVGFSFRNTANTNWEADPTTVEVRRTASTPIYIGDTQLEEDEYVSYDEQKIYKHTDNSCPPQDSGAWNAGYINTTGNVSDPTSAKEIYSDYIAVSSDQTYNFKNFNSFPAGNAGTWYAVGIYDANKNFISRPSNLQYGFNNNLKYHLPSNAAYVRLTFRAYDTIDNQLSFTLGDIPPAQFIPYIMPADPPVPLPEIPTIDGETVIDYDGDPKPSQMYIKYRR